MDPFREVELGPDIASPRPGPSYNPQQHRDNVRAKLAATLLAIMSGLLLLPLVGLFAGWVHWDDIGDFITLTWGGVIGLVASTVGFYFGSDGKER